MQTSLRRIGLLTIAGSLSLTALLAIVVLLTADFNSSSGRSGTPGSDGVPPASR